MNDVHCSNENCGNYLGKTDGNSVEIEPGAAKLHLSEIKRRMIPLYCQKCHRITRLRRVKKIHKRVGGPKVSNSF